MSGKDRSATPAANPWWDLPAHGSSNSWRRPLASSQQAYERPFGGVQPTDSVAVLASLDPPEDTYEECLEQEGDEEDTEVSDESSQLALARVDADRIWRRRLLDEGTEQTLSMMGVAGFMAIATAMLVALALGPATP
jgi:hypothetical protein